MGSKLALSISITISAIALFLLIAASPDEATHKRVGYFKSSDRNRVIAIQAHAPLSDQQVRDILSDEMHTSGKITAVYLYPLDVKAPGNELTTAANMEQAFLLVADGWSHRLWIRHDGLETFDERET